jgi:hypothetical protein
MKNDFIYFKGPSREKIEAKLVNMSLKKQFDKAIDNNISWLAQRCIEKGIDPSVFNNFAIWCASYNEHIKIVKLLLNDKRVIDKLSKNELYFYKNLK